MRKPRSCRTSAVTDCPTPILTICSRISRPYERRRLNKGEGFMRIMMAVMFLAVTLAGQDTTSTGVTIQDLRNGLKDPARWLTYSGDYTAQRHSPLTQITTANV